MKPATYWVDRYALQPHPEGGYYAETYRSSENISHSALPERFTGGRAFSTGIYFLLEAKDFSAFHRIKADEMWHFYGGGPLEVYVIDQETGGLNTIRLGNNPDLGETFQAVVPANSWFASKPMAGSDYSFVGCTVAPGFDFEDFEMASRNKLSAEFPQHGGIISELTRC